MRRIPQSRRWRRRGEDDIDATVLLLHRGIQAIKVRETGDIPLNRGHILADLSYCCIQFALTATGDVDVRAL